MTDTVAHQRRTPKAPNHIKQETSTRPTYCVLDTRAFQMASKGSTMYGHMEVSNFEKVTGHNSELDTKKIGETKKNEHNTWEPERLVGQNQANADNEPRSQKKRTIQQIVQPKSEVQHVASQIICGRGVETC